MENAKNNSNKNDIYKYAQTFNELYRKLENGTLFRFPENNVLIKKYVDAKWMGNYRSLIYQVNQPDSTLAKNMRVLKTVEAIILKPFSALDQNDIDGFQVKLNSDSLLTSPTFRKRTPISFRFKQDLVKNLKQFYQFYRLYSKSELGTELPNIVEYIRVRRMKAQNRLIKFITKEEIEILIQKANAQQMKAFLSVYYETGARVIEVLHLSKFNCSYNSNNLAWTIRLPNEKGISTTKMPIELSFSNNEFNRWVSSINLQDSDYVFSYSYEYIRKYLSQQGKKYLGRHISPKEMRKGCTMYLVNSGASEQYIKAHLGWSPSSRAINHYIYQKAITRPDILKNTIQKDFYSDVMKENDDLKFKQKMQQDELARMQEQLESIKKEHLKMFDKMKNVEVEASRNIVKLVIEEKLREMQRKEIRQLT
jgi:integrase